MYTIYLFIVQTGEEDEMNIYQIKAKLFADTEKTHAWKERGKGTFKVNVGRKDTKMARLGKHHAIVSSCYNPFVSMGT